MIIDQFFLIDIDARYRSEWATASWREKEEKVSVVGLESDVPVDASLK